MRYYTNEVNDVECKSVFFQKLKNILSFSDYIKFAKQIPSESEHLEQKEKTIELIQKIWETEQKITENYTEDPLK